MSSTRSLPPGRARLRVVALLLAVLVPVVPAGPAETPPVAAEITEYDTLDTAPRPLPGASPRTAPPPRPAPRPEPAPGVPPGRPLPVPPGPPHALDALRTVVLRC
ncbi:hypothetical protein ACIBBD_06740 [Streptomyces sp. NPDC051315]|uniref:hypothetical protein n=1 Tax=Streptomyces sp. NPDC051315 TaxID=3365650 RepID=UPI00378BFD5E